MIRRLAIVLLLASLAAAQTTEGAGYASIQLQISGYAPKPQTLYLPQADARQSVDYGKLPVQYDSYGNAILVIEGNYSFVFDVDIDASKPVVAKDDGFPVTSVGPEEYLGDTPYSEVSDPLVRQRALDVARNSRTVLSAMRDIALWVNSYVEYDAAYWGEIVGAKETLSNRRGVCDEFTNVYAAMARSLGIPTRVATGLVYSGSQWQRHAWAESLVGGVWVPVDPTFSEIGLVNALHLRLYSAPSYLFYQLPLSLEDARVLKYSVGEYSVPLSLRAGLSSARVPPKGTFELTLNVTNTGSGFLIPTYAAQKTVGIELISDFQQGAIVGPGETKTLHWRFVAPFGERETYYVFLVGPMMDDKYAITVDPTLAAEGYSDLELKNVYASVEGGQIKIEAGLKNRGSSDLAAATVTVTTAVGTQQQSISLASGGTETLEFFFPAEEGTLSYEVVASSGNSSTNVFGTVSVPRGEKRVGVVEAVAGFLAENSGLLYALIGIIIAGALLLVLLVPVQEGRKIPFEEREEWTKLMKLRQG